MFNKLIKLFVILGLFYQTPVYSKSASFNEFNSRDLSNYFSGIIAFENKDNSDALKFFNASKVLLNKHDAYLKRYSFSLVLENKVAQAINVIKNSSNNENLDFFEAYLLLIADSLKKKKTLFNKKNFGNISIINQAFLRCYLKKENTRSSFLNLINNPDGDYSRYIFFYINYLIENNQIEEAKAVTDQLEYINSTLLLSQSKSWVDGKKFKEFGKIFSCNNHNDIVSEFLFLIYNLYLYGEYDKAKKILSIFDKKYEFYYWFRLKKEAQIIIKDKGYEEGIDYLSSKFSKIKNPNEKIVFDVANFYKNSKNYEKAIEYYTKIISSLDDNSEIKSDLLYRRGGSYERLGDYQKADEDLKYSLKINPDDAYVLNYLAYSWLERDYKIDQAMEMLEKAYALRSNDPYITDSIGWAYYLIENYIEAEKYIKKAVELMPEDPTVNDHYGDILWKLNRNIQARYFWNYVLSLDDADEDIKKKINIKIIEGLHNS